MKNAGNIDPFRFGDLIPVFILLAMLVSYLSKKTESNQTHLYNLYQSDSLVYTDSLRNATVVLQIRGERVVLKSTDSTVQILENQCPEKICQHSHPIRYSGQEIVCVPNRLVLKMAGERNDDVDIIAR